MSDNGLINMCKKHREIIAYVICGGATTLVSLVTYYLFAEFIFNVNNAFELQITNVLSWIISVAFAFVTNRIFVFQSKASPIKECVKFYVARIGTLLIDMFLMYVFVTLCSFDDMVVKTIVQIVVIVLNYVFGKMLVFKGEKQNEKV